MEGEKEIKKAIHEAKERYISLKLAEGKLDSLAQLKEGLGAVEFHQELLNFCDEMKDVVTSKERIIYDKSGFNKFYKVVKNTLVENMDECLMNIKMYNNHQESLSELEKGRQ